MGEREREGGRERGRRSQLEGALSSSRILSEHPLAVCGIAVDLVRRLSPFVRQMDFALDWMELEAGRALYRYYQDTNQY